MNVSDFFELKVVIVTLTGISSHWRLLLLRISASFLKLKVVIFKTFQHMNRRRNIQCPILFLYVLKWCFCQGSDNVGNLIDPCNFPSPQFANLAGLCQFHYHQVKYVCDPLALLSRTETEILEKRFQNYSLSGCVDCKANPGYELSKKKINFKLNFQKRLLTFKGRKQCSDIGANCSLYEHGKNRILFGWKVSKVAF